ncbi:MAG: glycosyltransferase, partial [Sulfurovaceae bacterium]|nr:glycosyltransferase [Sulfurovaceae bacterium]
MKKCIIILGMHRSGTSLVSGLVSLQGFHLGTSKMPEHKDNPKGFFENMKIFRFNDKILKDHNSSWDNNSFCYKDIKSENIKFYKQEVKKIIEEEFANAKNILIKDPRMSLLFPLWEDVLLEMGFNIKIILVFRNPIEVALSLQQRNSFALEKSIPIWFHYSLQAEKNSRKYKVFLIHYTDDFNYFEGFTTRLSNFLNVKPTKNIISSSNNLYTPKLRHHTINLEEIPKNHPSDVRTLFSIFKQKKLFLIKNNYHDFYNPAMLNSYKNNKLNIQIKDSEIKQHGLIYKSNKNCRQLEKEINNKNPPVLKKEANESILVSIIIINRDGVSHLLKMMPALYKNTSGINYELIIIDNASSDDSIIYLENCNYNIDITIIRNKNNESFSKANNKAATYAKGRYLLLLNNDTKPLKGWLDYLLHVAENNNNIGSVGSRLIYPHRKTFKKSCNIQHAGIIFQDETSFFRPFNQGNGASHRSQSIDNYGAKSALTAACLLVPTDVYKEVGGLDEQYIFGYEDVDFGLKLLKAGYQNYYCPDSVLFHYEFGTQEKDHDNDIIKRRKSNIDLLRQRWFTTIKQSYWEEKLYNKSHLFSETALQIAIIVTDYGKKITAKDYILSKELAKHFNTFGWTTYFLSPINNNYYKIDNEIDVVISLLETYDLEKIPKREKRLTTIAWTTRKHLDLWCKAPSFNQYDIVFTPDQNSCDYIKAHNYQKSVVFPDSTSPKPSTQKSSYNQAQLVRNTLVRHFLSTSVAINIPSPTWIGIDSCADYHIAILLKQKLEQQGYYALLQIYPEWESNNAMGYDVVLVLRGMHQYKPKHHQINIMWNTICSDIITEKECKEYDAIFPMSCKEKDGDGDLSTPIKKIFKSTNTNYFHSLSIKSNQQKMLFKGNLDNTYNKIITDLTLIENNLSSYDKKRKSIMYNQHEIEDCIINNESSKYYNLAFKALILTNKNNNIRNLKDFINRLDSITTFEQKITDLLEHSNINIDQEIINEFISIYKNNKNKQLRKLNTIHDDLYLHYESFVHNDSLLRNEISQLEIKLVIAKKMKASSKEEADNKLIVYMQGADEKLRIAHLNASNKAKEIKEGILRANERVKIAKKETKWKEEQKLKTFKREADEKLRIALLNASNKAKEIKEGILRADERVKIAKQETKWKEE